jgi:DNA-binding NarL/FixJ family response regulator
MDMPQLTGNSTPAGKGFDGMGRPVRILIADDQRPARQGLKALLSLFPDVEVVGEAGDGQGALDLARRYHPDVVLLDVQMPRMDGLEAARRIKDQWPQARVVVLTMHASYREEALAAGADVFLVKGCAPEELQRAVAGSLPASGS